VARLQDHPIGRNIDVLAGVVYLILRKKSTFGKSTLTTPAGKRIIVNASKLAIPATPSRLRREESYLPIILISTAVKSIKLFLKLTAMGYGVGMLRKKLCVLSCDSIS